MITEAFLHCHGIGPVRIKRLRANNIVDWSDVLSHPERIPFNVKVATDLVDEVQRSQEALQNGDIKYLSTVFSSRDYWRILGRFFDCATFFDIETSGLSYTDYVTVISCFHKGKMTSFVENENLDDFVEFLDQVDLLVSFNGASFDVPRILDTFHLPELPCGHIDMRWLCYHCNYTGGLKCIADELGILRPSDLSQVDGAEAVELWNRWHFGRERHARSLLVRYCCADVLLLVAIAARALTDKGYALTTGVTDDFWSLLPED